MAELNHFYQLFEPTHYDIFIDINREKKQIQGTSTITGDAKEKNISIHQKYLTIESVISNGTNLPFEVDDKNEAINIELSDIGEVTLEIKYNAKLTDTMMGIYPSYYEVDGVKKQIIGTQFETTFARQAFPSVDEPEAKATFDLAIKFDEHDGETILSNMPEVRNEGGVHYFDTTVRMSTYLIAFAFGELQSKMTTTKSGVQVGVFGTKAHASNELDFALDIAQRSIEFFEEFYETPYPLPHSWQLALPDFSAGAMENWGLITYREAYLLLDPENTALNVKQLVATVIAHELAHQWFGDLVTMKWWDDLWLNESFANMMEYVAIDAIQPDWHIWELFQTSDAPAALQRDATDGVQSVHVQVNDPAEIDSLFDGAIVYAKGARMLVMVRALIGDDALRAGLKNYFAEHKYSNARGADLWDALGKASGLDLGAIMNSWLEQPGYPVVTAKIENGDLVLNQKQFFIGDGVDKDRYWQIPLNANYDQAPKLMTENSINLGNYADLRTKNAKSFRLNMENNSHFIVNYDQELLDDILNDVDNLDAISKLQILQDLRLLAESRQISYSSVVPLLNQFSDNDETIVNDALYTVVGNLKKFVQPDSNEEQNLRKLYGKLSEKQVAKLGWEKQAGESNDNQLTRPIVLSAALYSKNPEMISKAHDLFKQNKSNLAALPADTRTLILANEVRNYGDETLFENLLNEYVQTSDPSYKNAITSALTSATDEKLLTKLIEKFEDASVIKPQDLRAWFYGVLNNSKGEQLAWDWIRNEWQWLEDTVGGDMEFTTFILVISRVFRTNQRLSEFKEFFEPKLNQSGLTREITMDISVIETRVNLIENEKDSVNKSIEEAI
ncbi:M1 family metallopeptidase [Lactobacillus terrae]|uniref:M1 family metallopeptidase n=1 Tax=Lactobacillus terrae TaxID=2269374 RepID=UPI000C1B750C|nr:M1 family metallopeptidase [Lactobacillus terrae]